MVVVIEVEGLVDFRRNLKLPGCAHMRHIDIVLVCIGSVGVGHCGCHCGPCRSQSRCLVALFKLLTRIRVTRKKQGVVTKCSRTKQSFSLNGQPHSNHNKVSALGVTRKVNHYEDCEEPSSLERHPNGIGKFLAFFNVQQTVVATLGSLECDQGIQDYV